MIETKNHSSGSGPSGLSSVWLVIFADLVALLLTFFVMLFSMSNVTVESWQKMVDALNDQIFVNSGQTKAPGRFPYMCALDARSQETTSSHYVW